jgi:spore maturation protein CgeB
MSEDKRDNLGENGRKFVEENHTYSVLANKLISTINDVINI